MSTNSGSGRAYQEPPTPTEKYWPPRTCTPSTQESSRSRFTPLEKALGAIVFIAGYAALGYMIYKTSGPADATKF